MKNEIPMPTIVKGVKVVPQDMHNNFALRLELYGCKLGKWSVRPIYTVRFVVYKKLLHLLSRRRFEDRF